MILEFVHGFSKILQVTEFFRLGVSFEIIERALTKQEITGPLVDLIQMLLCAIFKMQDDEISVDYYYVSRRKYIFICHTQFAIVSIRQDQKLINVVDVSWWFFIHLV